MRNHTRCDVQAALAFSLQLLSGCAGCGALGIPLQPPPGCEEPNLFAGGAGGCGRSTRTFPEPSRSGPDLMADGAGGAGLRQRVGRGPRLPATAPCLQPATAPCLPCHRSMPALPPLHACSLPPLHACSLPPLHACPAACHRSMPALPPLHEPFSDSAEGLRRAAAALRSLRAHGAAGRVGRRRREITEITRGYPRLEGAAHYSEDWAARSA